MATEDSITIFEQTKIRSLEHAGEMWFSVVDIIEVLTDSKSPRIYWAKLKEREPQLLTICQQLKLLSADGKKYKTDCANTEGVLRLIQSVPSPKAEPFKLWLASLGKQNLEETGDPELGFERLRELYKAKGYTDEWIKNRLQSINTRKELTDEWKKRGITEGSEYAHLTASIAKGTFDLTPTEHAQLKGLDKKDNLRDHMNPLELIFTALGEEITRQFAVKDDAQGFHENHDVAIRGGKAAGKARQNTEETTGLKVISSENFLNLKANETPNSLPEEKTE